MIRNKEFVIELSIHAAKSAVAVIIALVLVNIFQNKIVGISKDLRLQKQASFTLEKRSQTIRQLQNDFKLIGEGEKFLETSRPDVDNVVDFKAALESAANRQAMPAVVEFSQPSADQSTIDYMLTFSSGAVPLIGFLKYFETMPYLTAVRAIDIRAEQGGSIESTARVNLRGRVYTKPLAN